jgi:DNA-directed RNA polymerase subunit E'/Rpb7
MLHPQYLGKNLKKTLNDQLVQSVEGTSSPEGRVVFVLRVHDDGISKGAIDPMTGYTRFEIPYDAIMLKAFKNEVLDLSVHTVMQVCLELFFYWYTVILHPPHAVWLLCASWTLNCVC